MYFRFVDDVMFRTEPHAVTCRSLATTALTAECRLTLPLRVIGCYFVTDDGWRHDESVA